MGWCSTGGVAFGCGGEELPCGVGVANRGLFVDAGREGQAQGIGSVREGPAGARTMRSSQVRRRTLNKFRVAVFSVPVIGLSRSTPVGSRSRAAMALDTLVNLSAQEHRAGGLGQPQHPPSMLPDQGSIPSGAQVRGGVRRGHPRRRLNFRLNCDAQDPFDGGRLALGRRLAIRLTELGA